MCKERSISVNIMDFSIVKAALRRVLLFCSNPISIPFRMLEGWYFGERPTAAVGKSMNQEALTSDRKSIKIIPERVEITETSTFHSEKSDLEKKEKSLNFGIFLTTYMYFQALHLLKQLKCTWLGTHKAKAHENIILSSINVRARDTLIKTLHRKSKFSRERIRSREEEERDIAVRNVLNLDQ